MWLLATKRVPTVALFVFIATFVSMACTGGSRSNLKLGGQIPARSAGKCFKCAPHFSLVPLHFRGTVDLWPNVMKKNCTHLLLRLSHFEPECTHTAD